MTREMEARLLETQLADLRNRFDNEASPIMTRLAELRQRQYGTDQHLLIPRQPGQRAHDERIPRQF